MSFDYSAALTRLRDARNKRSRASISKRFIEALRREHRDLSVFDADRIMKQPHSSVQNDRYSNELLRDNAPRNVALQGLVAKSVNGNGNCLFNSASVALIGKEVLNLFVFILTTVARSAVKKSLGLFADWLLVKKQV